MALRIVEVVASRKNCEAVIKAANKFDAIDVWQCAGPDAEKAAVRILVAMHDAQPLLDRLQSLLGKDENVRITLQAVLATLPAVEADQDDEVSRAAAGSASREELYENIFDGARADSTFFVMVVISTLVAAIGLITNNIAVVIGAMLIAPLLGPNLAFAFGAALGDRALMLQAARTTFLGLTIAILLPAIAPLVLPISLTSHELLSRTHVSYEAVALALGSGAAAVFSLTSGMSSALVGVMVAVALLPPATTFGLMLGGRNFRDAMGAGTLLGVNLVCIILAAQIVFVLRGLKPRTWWQKKGAKQSLALSIAISTGLLLLLVVLIHFEGIRTPALEH